MHTYLLTVVDAGGKVIEADVFKAESFEDAVSVSGLMVIIDDFKPSPNSPNIRVAHPEEEIYVYIEEDPK